MGGICVSASVEPRLGTRGRNSVSVAPVITDMVNQKSWFAFLYERYFPKMVIERFMTSEDLQLKEAERQFFPGVVAFVDISGFTKLSEKLATEHGENGAELLNKFISGYFEKLIEVIMDWGGDIIKFAGDAMLVVWRNQKSLQPSLQKQLSNLAMQTGFSINHTLEGIDESLFTLTLRAVACNLALIEQLDNFVPAQGFVLSMHMGIGAGELSGLFVGGVQESWEFFVAGAPIQQMADAGEEAIAGQVVISNEAYKIIQTVAKGKLLSSGNFLIHSIDASPQIIHITPIIIPPAQEPMLLSFIPRLVKRRVEAGQNAAWLAEYRKVFIMFVKLPAIDYANPDVLTLLQSCVCAVQESIFSFEGMIARLLADDKGTRFKICFGMPANTHENDGERVVLAALDIQKRLSELSTPASASIGIACGTVFCGEAGSSKRCEYTAVGYKVNMAARLMQAAGKGGILVEQATYEIATNWDVEFQRLPPIRVKGMTEPVSIFKPIGKKATKNNFKMDDLRKVEDKNEEDNDKTSLLKRGKKDVKNANLSVISFVQNCPPKSLSKPVSIPATVIYPIDVPIVGRVRERNTIRATLSRLWFEDKVNIILFEGDGGIGKSILMLDTLCNADMTGLKIMVGQCTPLEKSTAYYAFAYIFDQACGIDPMLSMDERTALIFTALDPEDESYFSLLNSLLQTRFPSTQLCSEMVDDSRAKMTRKLLISVFSYYLSDHKSLIAIEDLNYMDPASWSLLIEMIQSMRNIIFVLSCRPFGFPLPPDLVKLVRFPNLKKFHLELFSQQDVSASARRVLGIKTLPSELESFIFTRTKGHPLYIEEICKNLLSRGYITIGKNRECILSKFSESDISGFPDSVEGMIVDRIDHMPPGPELTIKVCGVVGKEFSLQLIANVHPQAPPLVDLISDMNFLVAAGFLQIESTGKTASKVETEKIFSFKNGFFQEVAYGLLLLSQRKAIHKAVVEHYEISCEDEALVPLYGMLSYHLEKAEEWWRALVYAEKAASAANKSNSSADVCGYYRTAIRLLKKFPLNQRGPPELEAQELLRMETRRNKRSSFLGDDEMGKLIRATGRRGGALTLNSIPEDSKENEGNDTVESVDAELPYAASIPTKKGPVTILELPRSNFAALKRMSTTKLKITVDINALDDTIKERIEKSYICLAEALFSKGNYNEALLNFKFALESINANLLPSSVWALQFSFWQLATQIHARRWLKAAPSVADNSFQLISLAKLLFRVSCCCLYEASESAIFYAAYYTYKCVDIADRIDDAFIKSQAYAQAAYCSILMAKHDDAAKMFEIANQVMISEADDMTDVELGILKMKFAIYLVSIGELNRARLFCEDSKRAFEAISSHRKLREAHMLIGLVEFFQGQLTAAMKTWSWVLKSSLEDGDLHLESESRKWTAVVLMCTKGSSKKATEHLDISRDVYKEERKVDFTLDMCSAMNEYYRSLETTAVLDFVSNLFTGEEFMPTIFKSTHSPLSFNSAGAPVISEWHNGFFLILFINLLFDCVELSKERRPKRLQILSYATRLFPVLSAVVAMFPIYLPFSKLLVGRRDWIRAREEMGANIKVPFSNAEEKNSSVEGSSSEDLNLLQRNAIASGRSALDAAAVLQMDYLLACAHYYMHFWEFNEPPPPPIGIFSQMFASDNDFSSQNALFAASSPGRHSTPSTAEQLCRFHYNTARSLFIASSVEFFHHPAYPLLHTREPSILVALGFSPDYQEECDEIGDNLFTFSFNPSGTKPEGVAPNFISSAAKDKKQNDCPIGQIDTFADLNLENAKITTENSSSSSHLVDSIARDVTLRENNYIAE